MSNSESIKKSCIIALCRTSLPENIGASARACSVMGFEQLALIDPRCDTTSPRVQALASNAFDIVEKAVTGTSLDDLFGPEDFLIGFSNRGREIGPKSCFLPELGERVQQILTKGRRAVFVFGSERSGLSNEEMECCDLHCYIPTFNEHYQSLNLAQAVQVVSYAMGVSLQGMERHHVPTSKDSSQSLKKSFLSYLQEVVHSESMQGFSQRTTPERTFSRLKVMFNDMIKGEDDLKFLYGFIKNLVRGKE